MCVHPNPFLGFTRKYRMSCHKIFCAQSILGSLWRVKHITMKNHPKISAFILRWLSWYEQGSYRNPLVSSLRDIGWSLSWHAYPFLLRLLSALQTGRLICTLAVDCRAKAKIDRCNQSLTQIGWPCSFMLSNHIALYSFFTTTDGLQRNLIRWWGEVHLCIIIASYLTIQLNRFWVLWIGVLHQ